MKYLFLALSVVFIFAACNKAASPSSPTRLDMLRASKWKMSSGTIAIKLPNGKDTILNYFNYVPICHQDDYISFNSSTLGSVNNGSVKCSPNDPDSTQFQWALGNNNTTISFFRGFSMVWSIVETIQDPFVFDTLSQSPLELDTLHGVLDTALGFTRAIPILDTIWKLNFVGDSIADFNIYNAAITNFSATSFTIYYTVLSTYPDSTNHHTGQVTVGTPPTVLDLNPIMRPDTFKYTITYTSM